MLVVLALTAAPLRVLFVGDSFTYFNNLPGIVQRIADATPGRKVQAERVTSSSWILQRHWREGRALARIREGRWDVVVLQEMGAFPVTAFARFERVASLFAHVIRAAGARPMLFMTWAHRQKPWSQAPLTSAYRRAGADLRIPVVPVGEAWRRWLADPTAPRLYVQDDIHPDFRGSFLSALVIVGRLRGQSLSTAPTAFEGLGVAHSADDKPFDPHVDPADLPRLVRCAKEALAEERERETPRRKDMRRAGL